MKVTALPSISPPRSVPGAVPASSEATAAIPKARELSLSDAARAPSTTLHRATQSTAQLAELRESIQTQRYIVDADLIAERLLQWQL